MHGDVGWVVGGQGRCFGWGRTGDGVTWGKGINVLLLQEDL